jgi:hypothetical protein
MASILISMTVMINVRETSDATFPTYIPMRLLTFPPCPSFVDPHSKEEELPAITKVAVNKLSQLESDNEGEEKRSYSNGVAAIIIARALCCERISYLQGHFIWLRYHQHHSPPSDTSAATVGLAQSI